MLLGTHKKINDFHEDSTLNWTLSWVKRKGKEGGLILTEDEVWLEAMRPIWVDQSTRFPKMEKKAG